ncbi:MAG: 50S ribosomal protein L35 [Candidatus Omnitrophica bacterium]|nr:50S ribosomal protein L35 [Candidatus Omnitrophota bacterium]
MGKLKTKKGVAKRFKLTKTGKVKHPTCGKGHLLSNKKSSRLRRMRRPGFLTGANQVKYIKRVLPYG